MAITRPTQGTKVAPFSDAEITSIWDSRLDTGLLAQIERYGKADRVLDFLRMPEREIFLSTRKPKVTEMLPVQADVKANAAVATSVAGASSTFVVSTDDRSSTGHVPLQAGEGLLYPGDYTISGNDALFIVQSYNSATYTATLYPAVSTEGVGTEIPAGTVFKIHGSYHGYESDQPAGKRTKQVERTYAMGLVKTTGDLGGGAGALNWQQVQWSDDSSRMGFIEESQYLVEFDHDKKLDDMIFFNEEIDNTNITDTTKYGTSVLREASKGLWNHAEDSGQTLSYSGTWDSGNFYDYKELAISQLVSSRDVHFYYGYSLGSQIEQASLDFLQAYSGGSDLFMASTIGIDAKYYQLDGFTFMCKELESFRNAIGAGNQNYAFHESGMMIPVGVGAATIDGKTEQHPNIMIGYLAANGINRKRSFGVINGPTGANYGVNDTYDTTKMIVNTEYSLLVLRPNQFTLVKKA